MKLPAPIVRSFRDAQLNFDALSRLFALITGVNGGQVTVTFSGATASNTVTVAHGLGRVPKAVVATSSAGFGVVYHVTAITSTSFDITGFYPPGALTGAFTASWIAVA